MDEVTWLEAFGRHRELLSRQRVAGDAIRIGRAYDNDVVLDDPHVAAHHLRLVRSGDGRWTAEDLGSRNGSYVDGERARRDRIALDGATTLRIGQTTLRLRRASDPVAEEQPLARGAPYWPLALGALALLFALELLGLWLGETGEPKLIRYLMPLATVAVAIALWTTLWSVLSRVFSGHARFGLHLLIVSAGLLAFSVYEQGTQFGAFALSWTALAGTVYIAGWLVFAAIGFAHLRALGPSRPAVKAFAMLALAALGITMQTLRQSEMRANYGQAATLQRLEPPFLRLVPAASQSAFFARSAALRETLDQARSREPAGGDDDVPATGED